MTNWLSSSSKFKRYLIPLAISLICKISDNIGLNSLSTVSLSRGGNISIILATELNYLTVDDPPSTDPQRAAKRQGWVNLNAFSAKLSAKGIPQLDESSRAGAVLRDTLEKTPWDNYHHADIDNEEDLDDEDFPVWKAHQLELRDVRSLNGSVPAASMWIKFNGNGIYEMKGEMEDEYDYDKTNWTGPKGWSKERFRYWQERFEWISKVTALDKETRKAAREAANLMKGIQSAN